MLIFAMVVTLISIVGGMTLGGLKMWLKRGGANREEISRLVREELAEAIQEELAAQLEPRDREIEELHERVEFAERLLANKKTTPHLDSHSED